MRMCDRYSLTAELSELTEAFRIDRVHVPYTRRYNIAPTQQVPVIEQVDGERCLNHHRWGLIPYWGKSSVHVKREMLADKPYLRYMLAKKRCVVPCSGFYFWRTDGKVRRAWRIVHRAEPAFAMAGIYEIWIDSEKREYPMCTVITTDSPFGPDYSVPLILHDAAIDAWLDPEERRPEAVRDLLFSLPEAEFRAYPVTPRVMDATLEAPECIAELDPSLPPMKV